VNKHHVNKHGAYFNLRRQKMKVSEICRRGYFDRVIVDGYLMPMYNNKGIEIKDNEPLVDAIENNAQSYNQGIGKIRINIAGEAFNTEPYSEIVRMQEHRENDLRLIRTKLGDIDRYNIGYVDILILKSDYSFPNEVKNRGKTKDDISKLAKSEEELRIMSKALDVQQDIIKENNGIYDCNIAIVDRVYINSEFRQCGISTWVHNNIGDITKIYAMVDIAAVLLTPGDFSNEAEKLFGMTTKQYQNMLIKHYKSVGYILLDNKLMCKRLVKKQQMHIIKLTKHRK
jgi:hypothetical protein